MPICPKCGLGNSDTAENCAECGAGLPRAGSTGGDVESSEDLVQLATFHTVAEADMVQELLETNGITAVLHGETDPIAAVSGAEPIALMVGRQDLANAQELFEAFFSGEAAVQEDETAINGE